MRKMNKKNAILACLSLSLAMGAVGVATLSNKTVSANATFKMEKGASLYLDDVSGLKFSFTDSEYDAQNPATYGMLIVPFDYLAAAGIEDIETETDFIGKLNQAYTSGAIQNKPITQEVLPQDGVFSHSVGSLYNYNYVREFFGIGYKEVSEGVYEYAQPADGYTRADNVRSVFEVANLALNCHVYDGGDLDGDGNVDAEETEEYNKISNNKTNVENFVTTGFEFVYGDTTPTASLEATYIGGEITPEVSLTPLAGKEHIQPNIHWNYAMAENSAVAQMTADGKVKGVTRGQGTLNAGIGGVMEVPATVSVLKDTTELQIYKDSKDANFFAIDDTSFAGKMVADGKAYSTIKLDGGYWNGAGTSEDYKNPGYFVVQNPNDDNGQYTIGSTAKTTLWIDFYFTGNNMPNVEFFGTKLEGMDFGKYGGGTTGYMFTNGVARDNTYLQYVTKVAPSYNAETQTYDTSNWLKTSDYYNMGIIGTLNFFRFGMSAYGAFNRGKYNANYDAYFSATGYNSTSGLGNTVSTNGYGKTGYNIMKYNTDASPKAFQDYAVSYGSKASMYELMKDETQQWHYKVGMRVYSSHARFWFYLYAVDKETGVETLYTSRESSAADKSTGYASRSGYITVYGALKGSQEKCKEAGNENYYYTEIAYTLPRKASA